MKFTVEHVGGCALISGTGRLNMVQAPRLREVVAEEVGAGHHHVVIDMAGVEFVDSTGLGALVGCLKLARQAGGDLRIAAVNDQVRMLLKLTGMDRVLTPYGSPRDACPEA
jgi:anti-sigma B factor antagonist